MPQPSERLHPDPPEVFPNAPRTCLWKSDQTMSRVYHLDYPPKSFNPGTRTEPCGRFHFFEADDGSRVPVLYAAAAVDAAISETVFHDLPVSPNQPAVVTESRLSKYGLVIIRALRDLTLIELYGHGLRQLGLRPENLTSTGPGEYPRTVRWARALHAAVPEADGLVWMSRQFNAEQALILFGDRVQEADLEVIVEGVPLRTGAGRAFVNHAANAAGVLIV